MNTIVWEYRRPLGDLPISQFVVLLNLLSSCVELSIDDSGKTGYLFWDQKN